MPSEAPAVPLRIAGLGRYLPARVVENAEVEERCKLPAGWIARRSGVRRRRWVGDETNSKMGARAAREALASARLAPGEVELILNASGTSEQAIPDAAPLIQRELGLGSSGIACMSVHTTCLGFVAGLDVAASLLAAGRYRRILLVCADIASVGINFAEPESASLLGDGAAAAVLTLAAPGERSALRAIRLETYGDGAELTEIRGGGCRKHPLKPGTLPEDSLFHMSGTQVLRMARRHAGPFLERVRPGLSKGLGPIDLVVPHQPSLAGLQVLERFGWPRERIVRTLEELGNCVSASMPLTLYEAVSSGRLKRGDTFLLVGTGAGLSLGAAILTY